MPENTLVYHLVIAPFILVVFVLFTFLARASDCRKQAGAKLGIRKAVYQAFLREGIPMPVPQRVVQMKGTT
jgi:small-conductance mechanosensitive channel